MKQEVPQGDSQEAVPSFLPSPCLPGETCLPCSTVVTTTGMVPTHPGKQKQRPLLGSQQSHSMTPWSASDLCVQLQTCSLLVTAPKSHSGPPLATGGASSASLRLPQAHITVSISHASFILEDHAHHLTLLPTMKGPSCRLQGLLNVTANFCLNSCTASTGAI